jgi:hypothetical protein
MDPNATPAESQEAVLGLLGLRGPMGRAPAAKPAAQIADPGVVLPDPTGELLTTPQAFNFSYQGVIDEDEEEQRRRRLR